MGVETEYAVAGEGPGVLYGHSRRVDQLLDRAYDNLVTLRDTHGGGLFLENGSRLYIDSGNHPEFCTPECTNPTDLVRYVLAGEQTMLALSNSGLSNEQPLRIFKHNQDYLSRVAWGCHESYLHKTSPLIIGADIVSHLVTRIIFTGAGGFDVFRFSPEFLISPRISFLHRLTTESSTGTRGILHSKDEPHTKHGFHRFHLICGESLSSETAIWLKLATTALVIAMSDAGLRPGSGISLAEPLLAMALVANDEGLNTDLTLTNGQTKSPIAIQRHYLSIARAHQHDDFMPYWAEDACDRWEAMLTSLECGPDAVAAKLDWAIKRKVFLQHAQRRGFSPEKLNQWRRLLREVDASLALASEPICPTVSEMLSPRSLCRQKTEETLRKLLGLRFDHEELNAVLALVTELREIDVRFAELGDHGLFQQLDRAGVLDHHASGVTNIKQAMTTPPSEGRAKLRGEAIRECFKERERYRCDWQGIVDDYDQRILDLSDPFVSKADWSDWQEKFQSGFPDFCYPYYARRVPNQIHRQSDDPQPSCVD